MSATARTRGRLRIYLGAAPGVGKTFAMLGEGRRRAERGTDVVVAVVETHGRPQTAAQLGDLEVVPRRVVEHRGTQLTELDVDATLARAPEVALVDELAHTNAPGSRHAKRWQDIDELLDAGIDVVSTVNVQHLESVNDVVERITGIAQSETVPDAWVRAAEQIELVDMTPEALRRRMAHGNVYPAERVDAALANYFRPGNLGALRELALLWVADRVEDQLQHYLAAHGIERSWETRERVLVAVTGAPGNAAVVRRAARLAGRLGGDLVGVHITRADGLAGPVDGAGEDAGRRLVEELGGDYREVAGDDVAEALVAVARAERATQVVIGASRRSRREELTGGSVVNRLLRLARDLDVHVISGGAAEAPGGPARRPAPRGRVGLPPRRRQAAWALLVVGLPVLVAAMVPFRDKLGVSAELLLVLCLTVAVAASGGLVPGVVAAVAGALATNYFFVPPTGTLTVGEAQDLVALVAFVVVGLVVSTLVGRVARRSAEAARARAGAEVLARCATALATEDRPLPVMVGEVRGALDADAASVLRRRDHGRWDLVAFAGPEPAHQPSDGEAHPLGTDGGTLLVLRGRPSRAADAPLLEALLDQLSVAVEGAELQRAADRGAALEAADALRTGILQAVSHDLRTPLAGIKASVTSLLADDVNFSAGETEAFLRTIDGEVDRLDRVVGNLLDMSRLQSGTLSVLRRPTAVEEVVAAALADVGGDARRVEVRVPDLLPLLDVDAALVERALSNVVANAMVVQPPDVAVVVEAATVAGSVVVRVVDQGPGIPEDDRERVFQPFQRLGDRSNRAGVGLGMAIAQGFVRAVGGELELGDTPGGGLTVTVRLPVADAPATGPDGTGSP